MSRRLSTALLFATAIPLLPLHADAGVKSGASLHPVIAPTMHPMPRHKTVHGFGKFPRHHHHRRFFDWGLPITSGADAFYGSDYDPADEPGEVDPALLSGPGPFPGSFRGRAFYRTGCRSEEVSVSSSHGPTRVTVTRCSVPIPETPALK
jgi:hypothetical protein